MQVNIKKSPADSIRMAVITLLLAIIMISTTGCYFLPREEEVLAPPIKVPEKVEYDTVEVKLDDIINDVKCTGSFISVSQAVMFFKDSGRIKKIYFKVGDTVKKGQLLAELDTGDMEMSLKLQEIALRKAELNYEKLKLLKSNSDNASFDYDLQSAKLDIETNKIRLDSIKASIDRARLIAPIDGTIDYITDVNEGETISSYKTVARIADPHSLQLTYDGDKVGEFKLGAEVELKIKDVTTKGTVVATPADLPKDADATAKKSIRIVPEQLPESVKMGDTADIRLILERHDNVIVINRNLVNLFNGRKFVNVLKNGVREERDVETGIQNSTQVEIVKGLEVGELVIAR